MAMAGMCTFQFPVLLTLLLVSLGVEGEIPQPCTERECPTYDVVLHGTDFELRRYNSSAWISSYPMLVSSIEDLKHAVSMRLYYYFMGQNSDRKEIKFTAPVLVEVDVTVRQFPGDITDQTVREQLAFLDATLTKMSLNVPQGYKVAQYFTSPSNVINEIWFGRLGQPHGYEEPLYPGHTRSIRVVN
ncbi:hypothetical protein Fmac_025036 [Flemingia macrophylla]|uniref:Uncharacterized protein n=1 Tax=Flemingia macrophylla TaxID=520843 RepID=A0ABD1LR22_9FABA